MPDFDVGNPEINDLLDWVDQPPPEEGRNTHAGTFMLRRHPVEGPFYAGLMFYHRGNPTAGSSQRQPGFSGVAKKLLARPNCVKHFPPVGQPAQEFIDHDYVLVEVRFRLPSDLLPPAQVFAGLRFCKGAGSGGLLVGEEVRSTDVRPARISTISGILNILLDPDQGGWGLSSLQKTTVLSS